MRTVKGLGRGEVRVWEEDGALCVAALPYGANEFVVRFLPEDARKLASAIDDLALMSGQSFGGS